MLEIPPIGPDERLRPEQQGRIKLRITHVDVLQVQEVEDDAVPLPDDRRAQRPLDGASEDGAEPHRYHGDADPLVLRQAELHDLCGEKWRENYERPAVTGRKKRKMF